MNKEELEEFIKKFKLEEKGFYRIEESLQGFPTRKKLDEESDNFSKIQVNFHREFNKECSYLNISIGYEREINGESFPIENNNPKINEPIKVTTSKCYCYNFVTKKFYKKCKEIEPSKIIDEIYEKHIAPTKFFRGFFVRVRLFIKFIFKKIAKLLLKFISEKHITGIALNISPDMAEVAMRQFREKEGVSFVPEKKMKIKFLENEFDRYLVLVYCGIHLLGYFLFQYFNYKPIYIVTIFKNNYLTIIYVFTTFIFFEEVVISEYFRMLLRKAVIFFERLSSREIEI